MHNCTVKFPFTALHCTFYAQFHNTVHVSCTTLQKNVIQRFITQCLCRDSQNPFNAQLFITSFMHSLKSFVQALQVSCTIKMWFPTSQDWVTPFYLLSETNYKFYALFNCLISSSMHSLTRSLHKSLVWLPLYYAQLNMIICKSQHA